MLAEGMSISNKSLISYISVRRNTIEHLNKYFILVPLIGLCFRLTNHRISAQQKADNRYLQPNSNISNDIRAK